MWLYWKAYTFMSKADTLDIVAGVLDSITTSKIAREWGQNQERWTMLNIYSLINSVYRGLLKL